MGVLHGCFQALWSQRCQKPPSKRWGVPLESFPCFSFRFGPCEWEQMGWGNCENIPPREHGNRVSSYPIFAQMFCFGGGQGCPQPFISLSFLLTFSEASQPVAAEKLIQLLSRQGTAGLDGKNGNKGAKGDRGLQGQKGEPVSTALAARGPF